MQKAMGLTRELAAVAIGQTVSQVAIDLGLFLHNNLLAVAITAVATMRKDLPFIVHQKEILLCFVVIDRQKDHLYFAIIVVIR